MVWLVVDYNNTECVFTMEPSRSPHKTWSQSMAVILNFPKAQSKS